MTMRQALIAVAAGLALLTPAASAETADTQTRAEQFAQLPFWPGYWVSEFQANTTIGGFSPAFQVVREKGEPLPASFMSLQGASAPWNEEGQKRYAAQRLASRGQKALGWGFPMMMNAATPIQFLITPEEVLIVNSYGEVRHIYTDGREMPAPEDRWPTVWGTSIGHWESEVLVAETVSVATPSDFFHGAPPLSDEARYVERFWLDGDRLRAEVTIEDPVTLSEPWKAELAWVREEAFDRMIHMDFANDRTGFDGELNTIEPPKD